MRFLSHPFSGFSSIPPGRYTLQLTDRAAGSDTVPEADIVVR